MAILRINDFEYKTSSYALADIKKGELNYKTDFWIGNMKINGIQYGNTCTFPEKKYVDYLKSRFAKIQSTKLYLKVDTKVVDDTFEGVNLIYNSQKVKTISKFHNDYLVVDFSTVLRRMMRRRLSNFEEFTLEIATSTINYIVFDKGKSYIELEYVPIGNTKSNRPSLKHDFGHVDLIEGSNQSRIFDIDCQALSIHHIYNSKRNIDENYNCGKRWSLSINQKLVKDNTYASDNRSSLYLYQDGTGTIEELEEKFYIDDNENRVYVNKKDVKILDNGILEYTYKNKPYIVNVEHISQKGLKLKTDITEYKKDISLELRDEDVANLEEQIESLKKQKKELKQSKYLMDKNKELEKLSKDIRTLENLLDQDVLPSDMNDKEYLQYKEIKDRIFALEKNYEAFLNDYNIGYYGVLGLKYLNNQSPEYLENPVTFRSISLSNFQHDNSDKNHSWVNLEKSVNEINANNYLQALRKKLSDLMADISKRYYTLSDQINETNYINQKDSYEKNLEEIQKNLDICNERLEKLYRFNPVNYLISPEKEIYCFNKYGDLVNIIDSTGKKLSIEYFHDKIYRVISEDEECLTFKYKNDLLVELKNNKGDKTTFTYDKNGDIIEIKRNDAITYCYYDTNHLLTGILDDKYTGHQFSYNEFFEVSQVSKITYTNKIAEGVFEKGENEIILNTTKIVYDSLNKTTIYQGVDKEDGMNLATVYVYDDDNNIKYIETERYDSEKKKKVKQRTAYDYVEKDYNIEVSVKDNKPNLLKESDFSNFTKNGEYYTLSGNDTTSSVATINIAKDRLENYSYLVLSVEAIAQSLSVANRFKSYFTKKGSTTSTNEPRFEISFTIVYANDDIDVQSQSFDWNITNEQYLFFPILVNPKYKRKYLHLPTPLPVLLDKAYDIKGYRISIDYSHNNGELLFKNIRLQEGEFLYQQLNDDNLVKVESDETNLYEINKEYDEKLLIKEILKKNGKEFDTTYHYDKDGKLLDTVDYLGVITEHAYNKQGMEVVTTTYHKENPVFKFYQEKEINDYGNVTIEKDQTGQYETKYEYDKNNLNVTKILQPNKAIMHYSQTPNGDVVSQSMIIDEQSNTNTKFYTKGLLTKLINDKLKYNFEYDGFGRKIKVIINDHPYCEITYDDKNKTKSTKYATNQGFKSTTNINDELVQIEYIDENNHPHTYLTQAYDEDGKIIKKQEFDNDLCYNTYTYSYDEKDNLTHTTSNNYQIDYLYDRFNRLEKEIITIGNENQSYQYLYDEKDNIEEIILPNNKRQKKITDVYDRVKEITYDKLNQSYTYQQVEDHLTNYVKEYKITFPQQMINYTYTYDEVGNIKIVEENKEEIVTYEYDKASRLVKEHNKKLNFTKTYIYMMK